ncbi:MAG: dihydroorotase [Acidimicrobiales bacterium]
MAELVIRGATVIDAAGERRADVAVEGGVIVGVGEGLDGGRRLDAGGCWLTPGFVDLNAHLGEPGFEEIETIETAARAAAVGGFTAVVAMPDTDPCTDSASVVREVRELARRALCEVSPAAALTVGRGGARLAPMGELAGLGVRLFVDAGVGAQDPRLLRRALEYAAGLDVTIAQHAELAELAAGGCMHEGAWSSRLGLPGIPAEAEEIMVMRDLALLRLTGGRLHFQHLSTAASAAMVAAAKAAGLAVSAEVSAWHLLWSDERCAEFDPCTKMSPPLRSAADAAALCSALAEGTIDALVSDHTPCAQDAKELPFDQAPPGAIGLETVAALAFGEAGLSPAAAAAALSWRPAAIAGLAARHGGPVAPGRPANLCVFDPTEEWTLDPTRTHSRSRNTPLAGRRLRGRVRHTILNGEPVVIDGAPRR